LQKKSETGDGIGGQLNTYTDVATVWCKIDQISVSPYVFGQAHQDVTAIRLTTRYQPSWYEYWSVFISCAGDTASKTPLMRFKYHNRHFRIVGVLDVDEEHEWLEFNISEIQ
jgi:head-tail adaptor